MYFTDSKYNTPMSRAGRTEHFQQESDFKKGNNHLLVIGINQYADSSIPKLRNARKDAEAVVKVLTESYGFENQHCTTLFDEDAKAREIIRAFGKLKQEVKNDDNLLIYIAGHGHYEDGVGYLIPYDGDMSEPAYSFLRHSTIKEDLCRIKAQHIFLVTDTCFSGALFSGTRNALPEIKDIRQFALNVAPFPSRIILTAGRIEEVSDGLYNDNSPFAKSFLTFLQNNPYEIFPVSSLIQHIRETVPNNARQQPDWGRLLDMNDQKGEMIFLRLSSEAADWQRIADSQNINDFLAFLRKHSYQSRYAEDALARIKMLEDQQVWNKVNKNSIAALLEFIRKNNDNIFITEAEERIDKLEKGFSYDAKPETPVVPKETKPALTKTAEDYFNETQKKWDEKDYKAVIELCTKAIEINPYYAAAYSRRARAVTMLPDYNYENVISDINKALEIDPKCAEAYLVLGNTKSDLQDYNGAIADYSKAIELNPNYTDAYNNQGNTKSDLQDYNGAIVDYSKAIELNPQFAIAYNNRGVAKKNLQDYNGAIADYTKAIELNPKDADAYNNRGNAKRALQDYNGAIADYTKAIELNPNYTNAYYNRALSYQNNNNLKAACHDWQKAKELGDPDAEGMLKQYCKGK